jgi:hypothetical protein
MPDVAVISMDNYNDATRIVDGNFDGSPPSTLHLVILFINMYATSFTPTKFLKKLIKDS